MTTVFRALILSCALLLVACGQDSQRETLRGSTMGTTWSLIYEPLPSSPDPDALGVSIEGELDVINQTFSTYIPDSEISLINARAGEAPGAVSTAFNQVLSAALSIGAATDGAYDVTVGPLVELWGFGQSPRAQQVPEAESIAQARARTGAERLEWHEETGELALGPEMSLDLSSIAKGYAVDRIAALVESMGVENFLVEIGGELRAAGERPEGGPWRLAVESPRPLDFRVLEALQIFDGAIATSGDYRNYFEVDGARYSHLVDPRTGYPVTHDLVSVTVVHKSCMAADAWATALIVLGRERARELADSLGLAVFLAANDGDELAVEWTEAFAEYLAP